MTAQVHEKLILDGVETSIAFCPPLPYGHPRIIQADDGKAAIESTNCWRGYIGTWEIKDRKIFLIELKRNFKILGEEPIFADWFTGILRIPRGKKIHHVHMGFGSIYEQELHIKIENGVVIKSRVVDNRGKDVNHWELVLQNIPGEENRFPGDDDL